MAASIALSFSKAKCIISGCNPVSRSKSSASNVRSLRPQRAQKQTSSALGPKHPHGRPSRTAEAGTVGAGVALTLLLSGPVDVAQAFGPESVPLIVQSYEKTDCTAGSPKNAVCIEVSANLAYTNSKPAYNSEVFGRVRFPDGESALYGDFAEASDAGKMGDIPDEINNKMTNVKFTLRLGDGGLNRGDLNFVNLKARTYPGMRADFRIMKPVSVTEGEFECEEASFGLECPEDLPF